MLLYFGATESYRKLKQVTETLLWKMYRPTQVFELFVRDSLTPEIYSQTLFCRDHSFRDVKLAASKQPIFLSNGSKVGKNFSSLNFADICVLSLLFIQWSSFFPAEGSLLLSACQQPCKSLKAVTVFCLGLLWAECLHSFVFIPFPWNPDPLSAWSLYCT